MFVGEDVVSLSIEVGVQFCGSKNYTHSCLRETEDIGATVLTRDHFGGEIGQLVPLISSGKTRTFIQNRNTPTSWMMRDGTIRPELPAMSTPP